MIRCHLARHLLASWLAVALLASSLVAQAVNYGTACENQLPAPEIFFTGDIVPGGYGSLHLSGAVPNGFVVLHAGSFNDQTLGGQPLPIDLSVFAGVAPGCSQYTSADLAILILNALPDGTLKLDFPISPALGSDLYFQWAVVESFDPLSITLTRGLHVSLATNTNLHVVMLVPEIVVDYDEDGQEVVLLDGSDSHTHEVGHVLTEHTWTGGTGATAGLEVLARTPVASVPLDLGDHAITLKIRDDHTPGHTLIDTATIRVVPTDQVPGVLARYHDAGGADPATLLDAVPATAEFAETLEAFGVVDGGGSVGGSPFTGGVMVRLLGTIQLPAAGNTTFTLSGGADDRLVVDATPVRGPVVLTAGSHEVDLRFAVNALADLPLSLQVSQGGQVVDDLGLVHDVKTVTPVLAALSPVAGISAGGNAIVLQGQGFFPADAVTVHWGDVDLGLGDNLVITAERIAFTAPPHAPGSIAVTVQSPQGLSNARTFTYSDTGPVPVNFLPLTFVAMLAPTSADWGPDGRLYVTTISGELKAVSFDDGLGIVSVDTYPGVSGLANFNSLGLTFNPFDDAVPVKVYVSHALLSADGGGEVTAPSTYHGQVSVLTGPDFDSPTPLITGLPQPNTAHQMNGMQFDNNGDLLLLAGSCTNAGVPHVAIGSLPESPLTASVLKAETSRRDFNGTLSYIDTATGLPDDDQRFGGGVDIAPGSHVSVHAPGLRNPYDLVYTTSRRLYATDNGPNVNFGPQSTGPTTAGIDAEAADEINLLEAGNYYGHPNRNRGRTDARQNVYHGPGVAALPDQFTQALTNMASSVDGITEYRSETFEGQLLGDLIVQKWIGGAFRLHLSGNGRAVESVLPIAPATGALDIVMAPGGGLITIDYTGNAIQVLDIDDASAGGMRALDITPWRAPATGGTPFVIGGEGFGIPANTSVTIGGLPATLTAVRARRIEGLIPVQVSATTELVDVVVDSNGSVDTLIGAFRYLLPPGEEPGRWEAGIDLPVELGDISAAVLEGVLYLFSHDGPETYSFDVLEGGWTSTAAARPFPGGGHGVVTLGENLYLIGGHGAGSEGKLQIYDHHDDVWTLGAELPWAGGGLGVAAIDGLIYAAGGDVSSTAVDDAAVYDPDTDTWTPLASLPTGEGHTDPSAGTDGTRFFLFGGSDGSDAVQIYDPGAMTWITSDQPGSSLTPMPIPRGNAGAAIFWQDELYIFGGLTGGGVVTDRVDVYDPATDTWRQEAPMPAARADIAPAIFQGRVLILGGSPTAAHGHSANAQIFTRQ